jgi:hypothetical protein
MNDTNGNTATLEREPTTGHLVLPDMRVRRLTARIEGLSPLITHHWPDSATAAIAHKQAKGAKVALTARDPDHVAREGLYLLDEAGRFDLPWAELQCGFPAVGLKKSLTSAAMRGSEVKGTEVRAGISVEADLLRIVSEAPPSIRTDHVVIMGRGNVAYRPQFWPWHMDVPLAIHEDVLSVQQALHLLSLAGFAIGIGDWRAEKNGTFGSFHLTAAIGR